MTLPMTNPYLNTDIPFPEVPEQVVLALEARFRDTLPTAVPPEGTIGKLIGQQEVIRFLRHTYTQQTNPNEE